MHLVASARTVLLGVLLMFGRVLTLAAGGMAAALDGSVHGTVLEQASLREDGLASRDGSAMLPHLGRRCELFSLRLNPQPEERFGGVLPDEPDLLLAHVPEFFYLRHDR